MEQKVLCNACAPVLKAEVTHTAGTKIPTQVNINGDYVLYGGLILVLYRLVASLRRAPKTKNAQPTNDRRVGISNFIVNVSEKHRREDNADNLCQPWTPTK